MIIIRICTFFLLTIVIAYPYPPTTYPPDGPYPPTLAYGSALLLTMATPASSFQSDKVGTYVISGERINGALVWRHTASVPRAINCTPTHVRSSCQLYMWF